MTLIDDRYEKLDSKSVLDSDGFLTDYTLYYDYEDDVYFCMFGDSEVYTPDINYADFETENEEEAWDFFDDYRGVCDEYDDVEECSSVNAASEEGNGYDDYLNELKHSINKICRHASGQIYAISDDLEVSANEYRDLSTHYVELQDDLDRISGVIDSLSAVRRDLRAIGASSTEDVESSTEISASTYDFEDFDGTELEDDLRTMKNDLIYIYNRLGKLQDKWFSTDMVYVINEAASGVGDAFTKINKALNLL